MKSAPTRTRVARGTAGLVVIAVLASGCGGSKSDADEVKTTVSNFFADAGDNKGPAACALLTDAAAQELISAAAVLKPPTSCAEAIATFNKVLSSDDKKSLKSTNVKKVTITGETATVADTDIQLKAGGEVGLFRNRSPKPLTLEKVGGEWKISSLG